MRNCCAVLFVLVVLTLGFDRVAGWSYGTTARMVLHYAGTFLEGL